MKMEVRDPFCKDDTKSEEESPCPPRADFKIDFEGQEGSAEMHPKTHTHKRRPTCHPPSRGPRHHGSNGSLNILRSAPPGEPSLTTMPAPRSPGHWIHRERNRKQHHTHVLCGGQGHQHRYQTGWEDAFMTSPRQANTLMGSDGEKKSYRFDWPRNALGGANKLYHLN